MIDTAHELYSSAIHVSELPKLEVWRDSDGAAVLLLWVLCRGASSGVVYWLLAWVLPAWPDSSRTVVCEHLLSEASGSQV